ncbi:hypothetical protein ABK040_014789 [Willaertia magna]
MPRKYVKRKTENEGEEDLNGVNATSSPDYANNNNTNNNNEINHSSSLNNENNISSNNIDNSSINGSLPIKEEEDVIKTLQLMNDLTQNENQTTINPTSLSPSKPSSSYDESFIDDIFGPTTTNTNTTINNPQITITTTEEEEVPLTVQSLLSMAKDNVIKQHSPPLPVSSSPPKKSIIQNQSSSLPKSPKSPSSTNPFKTTLSTTTTPTIHSFFTNNNSTEENNTFLQLSKHFITCWNLNYSPLKFAFTLKRKFINENLEEQIIYTFLYFIFKNQTPTRLFFDYLSHTILTELISIKKFINILYDKIIKKEIDYFEKILIWNELFQIIEYFIPLMLNKFKNDDNFYNNYNDNNLYNNNEKKESVIEEEELKEEEEIEEEESNETTNSVNSKKRKKLLNNDNAQDEIKKRKFINNNSTDNNTDLNNHNINNNNINENDVKDTIQVIMKSLLILLKYLNKEITDMNLINNNIESDKKIDDLTYQYKYIVCEKAIQVFIKIISSYHLKIFILLSKNLEKNLWHAFRTELNLQFIPLFKKLKKKRNLAGSNSSTMNSSGFFSNSSSGTMNSGSGGSSGNGGNNNNNGGTVHTFLFENLFFNLWKFINQFLIFNLTIDKKSKFHASDFKEHLRVTKPIQSTLSEKTCFLVSLLIEDEISTNLITKTRIENTFRRFDNLRIIKDRNFVNYFFDILFTEMDKIYEFALNQNMDETITFVFSDKAHKMIIRKSFIFAKFPLLMKMWCEIYCNHYLNNNNNSDDDDDELFYKPFIGIVTTNQLNNNNQLENYEFEILNETKYNAIEKTLYLISKYKRPHNNTQIFLNNLIDPCLHLQLIKEENIKHLIPHYTFENFDLNLNEQQIDGNMASFAQLLKNYKLQSDLILFDYVNNLNYEKLDFIIRTPSALDIIQLHGYIPNVLEKILNILNDLFMSNVNQNFNETFQVNFALAFAVLYIIAERFEFKSTIENQQIFIQLMNDIFQKSNQSLIYLKEWFENWFTNKITILTKEMKMIGDEILKELITIQIEILEKNPNLENNQQQQQQTIFNIQGIKTLRQKYSPAEFLHVSNYVVQQCLYWYSLKTDELQRKILPILALFCEQFGYHIEIGIVVGLCNLSNQIVFNDLIEKKNEEEINKLVYYLHDDLHKIDRAGPNFGFNISSKLLHQMIKQFIHLKRNNEQHFHHFILNYAEEYLQRLVKEEYLITKANDVKWQSLSTTPPSLPNHCHLFLPDTSDVIGNFTCNLSCSSSSAAVQTLIQEHFDNIFKSLTIQSPTLLNSIGSMKSTMLESFNHLRKSCQAIGPLNFLKTMLNQIGQCLLIEEQEPFESLRITETAAILFVISSGREGLKTMLREAVDKGDHGLFEFLLNYHYEQYKKFLDSGTLINTTRHASTFGNARPTPLQILSNVEYLYMLSSLFAYFVNYVLIIGDCGNDLRDLTCKFFRHFIIDHYDKIIHDEKHYISIFTITLLEHSSKVPELLNIIQQSLVKKEHFIKFCNILQLARKEITLVYLFGNNTSNNNFNFLIPRLQFLVNVKE